MSPAVLACVFYQLAEDYKLGMCPKLYSSVWVCIYLIEWVFELVWVCDLINMYVYVTSTPGQLFLVHIHPSLPLSFSSSSHSVFHLLTATNPVLLANNHSLTFAPYNSCYPKLELHLEKAGLTPHVNLWQQPLCITGGEGGGGEDGVAGIWCRMNPEDFYKMEVPFKMDGPTKVLS